MTHMLTRAAAIIVILFGFVSISARLAHAEYWPPPSLSQLAKASLIVQGHYKLVNGKPKFVVERNISPEKSTEALSPGHDLRVNEEGRAEITSEIANNTSWGFGFTRIDATRSRLWLVGVEDIRKFVPPHNHVSMPMAEPVELADGYLAMSKGEQPPLLFRALQGWDALLRRDAMEELVAGKDPQTLDRLHAIAADANSQAGDRAISILSQMKLLDADRYWDTWTIHPRAYAIGIELQRLDRARMAEQVLAALKQPSDERQLRSCMSFLHLIPDAEILPVLTQYLTHGLLTIRKDTARFLGGRLEQLYWQREQSPATLKRFEEFKQAVLPLLKKGVAEDADQKTQQAFQRELDQFENLAKRERTPDPPLTYQPSENLKLLLTQLTSHEREGTKIRRAGKELAKYEFEAGFVEMQRRLTSENFNSDMVMNGIGYIDDPRSFAFATEHLAKIGVGHRTYLDAVRAIARLNQPKSLEVILDIMQQKGSLDYTRAKYYLDALAELEDERAVAEIRKLVQHTEHGTMHNYVRALAIHNDAWAIDQLLNAADGKIVGTVFHDARGNGPQTPQPIVEALRFVDQPVATMALKRWVSENWRTRAKYQAEDRVLRNLSFGRLSLDLQNSSGDERRTTIIGEVARRDPNWLAAEALWHMDSDFSPERTAAYDVFRSLTARSMGFDPEDFHAERQSSLARLQAWWQEHRKEPRDQWLLSYFEEAGFQINRFDTAAIPTLVKALGADAPTHELALEQLERITDLLFDTRGQSSHNWQPYNITMVTGKLRARGWLKDQ